MKIESKGVQNALKMLPHRQQKYLMKAIRLSVDQGVALARTMASNDSGELAAGICGKIEFRGYDLVGSIEAAPKDAESQIKARAVEFGRRNARLNKGTRMKMR